MTSTRQTELRFQPTEPRAKAVVSRIHKGDLDRLTAYLPLKLGTELRTVCAARRLELSEAIAQALRGWLERPAVEPAPVERAAGPVRVTRADGVETQATTAHVPADMLRELRITAAERGEHMSAIVTEALYEWFMRRSTPAAPPETASKVPFSSYMSLADAERLQRLVESTGKSRVRLLSEAFALLFERSGTSR